MITEAIVLIIVLVIIGYFIIQYYYHKQLKKLKEEYNAEQDLSRDGLPEPTESTSSIREPISPTLDGTDSSRDIIDEPKPKKVIRRKKSKIEIQ